MKIEGCLSLNEVARLKDISAVFESFDGELLERVVEDYNQKDNFLNIWKRNPMMEEFHRGNLEYLAHGDGKLNLAEPTEDGSISTNSLFSFPEASGNVTSWLSEALRECYIEMSRARNKRKKLSAELSEFLFPLEDDTRVEFRSPVPGIWHQGQLKVVCIDWKASHRRKRAGGEFCLAACDDGIVKWLHESECVNGNQVWRVRLFDRSIGDVLYLQDELQGTHPKVYRTYSHCVIKTTYIGGNVNGSGSQTIGTVNCH